MPKRIIQLLLLLVSFESFATGIMMPAGLGYVLLFAIVIAIVSIFITIFLVKIIYKNSNNKPKTKKNIKRFFIAQFFLGLFVYYIWIPGYVSFTHYSIIDNNPLQAALEIKLQHGFYYFELSDGNSYEFKKKYRSHSKRNNASLKTGQMVMLSDSNDKLYTLNSIGNSNGYSRYLRTTKKVFFTIPLSFKKIKKNQLQYEGTLHRITDDWIADQEHLVLAINSDYCCDIAWIKKLLKHGANNKEVINKRRLLQRMFDLNTETYYQYRTEIITAFFLQSNVDINQLGYSKKSILHQTVVKINKKRDKEFNPSDRKFIQFLLDSGLDQNTADDYFKTPLMYAIASNNFQLAQFLLKNGAHFARRYSNRESAREIVKRRIAEANIKSFPTKETVKSLKTLINAMNKVKKQTKNKKTQTRYWTRQKVKTSSLDTKKKTDQSIYPILSTLEHNCDVLGNSWEKAYGIKVDNLTNLSSLGKQEKQQVKPTQTQFLKLGIIALAEYTCMYKATPLNTVTLKVFVFENNKSASDWWQKKYQYKGWEKHYTQTTDTLYKAVDSKQLTKRALLVNNLWITTHHLHDGKEHLLLLENVLRHLSLDQMVKLNTQ